MTPADESDSPRTDPNPGVVSGPRANPAPTSAPAVDSAWPRANTGPNSDTLLSAPQATREDLGLDQRLFACERQLAEALSRLEQLERRPTESSPGPAFPRWLWLVFLAALALAWQILVHFR
jgi:hypothetical protein